MRPASSQKTYAVAARPGGGGPTGAGLRQALGADDGPGLESDGEAALVRPGRPADVDLLRARGPRRGGEAPVPGRGEAGGKYFSR